MCVRTCLCVCPLNIHAPLKKKYIRITDCKAFSFQQIYYKRKSVFVGK